MQCKRCCSFSIVISLFGGGIVMVYHLWLLFESSGIFRFIFRKYFGRFSDMRCTSSFFGYVWFLMGQPRRRPCTKSWQMSSNMKRKKTTCGAPLAIAQTWDLSNKSYTTGFSRPKILHLKSADYLAIKERKWITIILLGLFC